MDETPNTAPQGPAPADPKDGQTEGPKRGVRDVAREAFQAYRNINKVDRWGGGGFTLSTLVKLAGWAGLISILAVLVMKLREVEAQLDPVTNIVVKLMKEVEASRISVKRHTQDTQAELEALKHEAGELKAAVIKTGDAEVAAQHALEEVDHKARALTEKLEDETSRAATLGAQGDSATETLKDYAKSLGEMHDQLQATSDQANANMKAIADALKKTNDQVADLQKTLATMQSSTAPASLAKVDAAAKDLQQSLDRVTQRVKAAEAALPGASDKKTTKPSAANPDAPGAHAAPAPSAPAPIAAKPSP